MADEDVVDDAGTDVADVVSAVDASRAVLFDGLVTMIDDDHFDCELCKAKGKRFAFKTSHRSMTNAVSHFRNAHDEVLMGDPTLAKFSCGAKRPADQADLRDLLPVAKKASAADVALGLCTTMVVDARLPLGFFDHRAVRAFFAATLPAMPVPSRKLVTTEVESRFKALMSTTGATVNELLKDSSAAMALVLDGGTSRGGGQFLAVKGMMMAPDFTIKEVLLGMPSIQGSHTKQAIADAVVNLFGRLDISLSKVGAIVSDGASAMRGAVDILFGAAGGGARGKCGQWCVNHRTHLVFYGGAVGGVPALGAIARFDAIVNKANALINMFVNSPLRMHHLHAGRPVPHLKFILAVRNRWNSQYDALARLVELWPAVEAVDPALVEPDFVKLRDDLARLQPDIKALLPHLAAIKRWSEELASTTVPTLPKVAEALNAIDLGLSTSILSATDEAKELLVPLKEALHARLGTPSQLERAAQFLDPARFGLLNVVGSVDLAPCKEAAIEISSFLFPAAARAPAGAGGADDDDDDEIAGMDAGLQNPSPTAEVRAECVYFLKHIKSYARLHEITKFAKISALEFWKEYGVLMPRLAAAARLVLATPASSTGVERTFSSMGIIACATRSQLTSSHIEMLTVLHAAGSARTSLVGAAVDETPGTIVERGQICFGELDDPEVDAPRAPLPPSAADAHIADEHRAGVGALATGWRPVPPGRALR
jgi:hypothetical protein